METQPYFDSLPRFNLVAARACYTMRRESSRCFYCDEHIPEPWQRQLDHFPKPKRCGGRLVVPACQRCHHMKDRAQPSLARADFDAALTKADVLVAWRWAGFVELIHGCRPLDALKAARWLWSEWPPAFRIIAAQLLASMFDQRQAKKRAAAAALKKSPTRASRADRGSA